MIYYGHRMFATPVSDPEAITVKSVTNIDADAPISFKIHQHALQEVSIQKEEPRFLESI
jgi:hypothetical protein